MCWMFSFEVDGFSCRLDVFYGGLGISKLQLWIYIKKFQLYIFSNFWLSKPWIRIGIKLKCRIRIRIQWIWIRNTPRVPLPRPMLKYSHNHEIVLNFPQFGFVDAALYTIEYRIRYVLYHSYRTIFNFAHPDRTRSEHDPREKSFCKPWGQGPILVSLFTAEGAAAVGDGGLWATTSFHRRHCRQRHIISLKAVE